MLRQIFLLVAGLFAFVGVTLLAAAPETVSAYNLSRAAALFVGFVALAVGVPIVLDLTAHHRLPKHNPLPRIVRENTGLEVAVLMMLVSVAAISFMPLQNARPEATFLAIAVGTLALGIASLEHVWGHPLEHKGRPRPRRKSH